MKGRAPRYQNGTSAIFHPLTVGLHHQLGEGVEAAASGWPDVVEDSTGVHPEPTGQVAVGEAQHLAIEEVEDPAQGPPKEAHLRIGAGNVSRADQHLALLPVGPHRADVPGPVREICVHRDHVVAACFGKPRTEDLSVAVAVRLHVPCTEARGQVTEQ